MFTVRTIVNSCSGDPQTIWYSSILFMFLCFPQSSTNDISCPSGQEKGKWKAKQARTHIGRVHIVLCWKMNGAHERHPLFSGMASPQKTYCWYLPLCRSKCTCNMLLNFSVLPNYRSKIETSVCSPAALQLMCAFCVWYGFLLYAFVVLS